MRPSNDPKRGFVGGYEMETLSLGLPFMAAFLNPGAWGRTFTSAMETYPRMAGMWLVGEDMPQETNRITLDPIAKDKFGMPVASVHFDDHPERRRDARPRLQAGRGGLRGRRRHRDLSDAALSLARTTWAPTG